MSPSRPVTTANMHKNNNSSVPLVVAFFFVAEYIFSFAKRISYMLHASRRIFVNLNVPTRLLTKCEPMLLTSKNVLNSALRPKGDHGRAPLAKVNTGVLRPCYVSTSFVARAMSTE